MNHFIDSCMCVCSCNSDLSKRPKCRYRQSEDFSKRTIFHINMFSFSVSLWILLILLLYSIQPSLAEEKEKKIILTVKEEVGLGTPVGDVFQAALLHNYVNPTFFMENPETSGEIFEIDKHSGQVTVGSRLDREKVCPRLSATQQPCYLVQVVSVNKELFINLKIRVDDINDNAPQFSVASKTVDIRESEAVGSLFPLDKAVDMDSLSNGIQFYKLSGVSGIFTLSESESPPISPMSTLSLRLSQPLDYEKKAQYIATLTACDAGNPPLCGNQQIRINVHDVNDAAPKFDKSEYSAVIEETHKVGQTVIRLRAVDSEQGLFGQVTYRFDRATGKAGKYFDIDPNTGDVYLRQRILGSATFKILVEARDGGDIPNFDRAWLTIVVLDINDHNPHIKIRPSLKAIGHGKIIGQMQPINTTSLWIYENEPVPFDLAFIDVTDGDTGENARVKCEVTEISKGASLTDFNLVKDNLIGGEKAVYKLTTTKSFDAEKIKLVDLTLRCYDHGQPPARSTRFIRINIQDRNEYAASFVKSLYETAVQENSPSGTFTVQVNTTDKDVSSNVLFDIDESVRDYFEINASLDQTGIARIYTRKPLDCELKSEFKFNVFAMNTGDREFRSSAVVHVNVLDVNDHAPEFLPLPGTLEIRENQPPDIRIGVIKAVDKDCYNNAEVKFKLTKVTSVAGQVMSLNLFQLDSSGILWVKSTLDRDVRDRYMLTVIAYDSGSSISLTSTTTLTVYVLDENDNSPEWVYPNFGDNMLNISTNLLPGQPVTRVRAVDKDASGANSNVTYRLEDGHQMFALDPTTGELRLINRPFEGRIDLKMTAFDSGSDPGRSTSITLIVFMLPDQTLATSRQKKSGINFALIMGMVTASTLVLMSLLIAIIVVRKRGNGGSGGSRRHRRGDPTEEEAYRKAEEAAANTYCPGDHWQPAAPSNLALLHGPGTGSNGFHKPTADPRNPSNLPNSQPLSVNTLGVDMEVASADSGHGASEEEVVNGLTKGHDPHHRPSTFMPVSSAPSAHWCPALPEDRVLPCHCGPPIPMNDFTMHHTLPPSQASPSSTISSSQQSSTLAHSYQTHLTHPAYHQQHMQSQQPMQQQTNVRRIAATSTFLPNHQHSTNSSSTPSPLTVSNQMISGSHGRPAASSSISSGSSGAPKTFPRPIIKTSASGVTSVAISSAINLAPSTGSDLAYYQQQAQFGMVHSNSTSSSIDRTSMTRSSGPRVHYELHQSEV